MKKALFVLHQKTSEAGDLGLKLITRGYNLEYVRPPLGDKLPQDLEQYSVVVIFGGPMSANDNDEFIKSSGSYNYAPLKDNLFINHFIHYSKQNGFMYNDFLNDYKE